MNHAGNCDPRFDSVIDAEFTEVKPKKRSFLDDLLGCTTPEEQIRREIEKEQSHALLAKVALDHIGALSMMEQQLSSTTPHAAGRYQAIVDSATRKALEHLMDVRW